MVFRITLLFLIVCVISSHVFASSDNLRGVDTDFPETLEIDLNNIVKKQEISLKHFKPPSTGDATSTARSIFDSDSKSNAETLTNGFIYQLNTYYSSKPDKPASDWQCKKFSNKGKEMFLLHYDIVETNFTHVFRLCFVIVLWRKL
jgi:hypothetical protein